MDLAVWTSRCRWAVLLLEDLGVLFLGVEVSAGCAPSGGPGVLFLGVEVSAGCPPSGGPGGALPRGRRTACLWAQQPLQPRGGSRPHCSFISCDPSDSLSVF